MVTKDTAAVAVAITTTIYQGGNSPSGATPMLPRWQTIGIFANSKNKNPGVKKPETLAMTGLMILGALIIIHTENQRIQRNQKFIAGGGVKSLFGNNEDTAAGCCAHAPISFWGIYPLKGG